MKILAVDTATESCSVAVVDNGNLVAEFTHSHGLTHTRRLMPMIDRVLDDCGLSINDMDGLAATLGPGSFTGLRIGLSTVKGLAFGASKPVAGVSALDVLARQFPFADCRICAMIDARKNEVYAAEYQWHQSAPETLRSTRAAAPETVLAEIAALDTPCLYVGNGARRYKDQIAAVQGAHARFCPDGQNIIRAAVVGFMAQEVFDARRNIPLSDLTPLYIRAPDAEIHAAAKPAEPKAI
ncbi:MAG: tRNA (adenosine(37)-N6)-threonylcarbamoyltransferase complex dimerization subunit type 1 TsaB [Thermodesulfobacteriota bacterium]